MRALLATFLLISSSATATTWLYEKRIGRIQIKIQDWDGQYRIFGSLYYNDGVGLHEAFYEWEGLIERLPNGRFSENRKIAVKRAVAKFISGSKTCTVPIEVNLYLPKGHTAIDGFYVESNIPTSNVFPIKGDPQNRCQMPQYFWNREEYPYWNTNSWD